MRAIVIKLSVARFFLNKLFAPFWRGVYYSRLSNVRLREIREPRIPGPEWVKIRTIFCGICTSDISAILFKNRYDSFLSAFASFPFVLGHEIVGRVVEKGAAVRGLSIGDRVNVSPYLACAARGITPPCRSCREGHPATCENFTDTSKVSGMLIGASPSTGGGWGEYLVAHQSQLHKVPDSVSDEVAAVAEPAACALHAAGRHLPSDDDKCLVIGCGMMGLCLMRSIRALGSRARVIAIAKYPFQTEKAKESGADIVLESRDREVFERVAAETSGRIIRPRLGNNWYLSGGADLVFDCVGNTRTITNALKMARERGRVVVVGMGFPGKVNWDPLHFKELTVSGTISFGDDEFKGQRINTLEKVYQLVLQGKLDLEPLVTHRFEISEYRKAFDTILHKERTRQIKTLFYIEPSSKTQLNLYR